jgi:hypothetical protein
VGSKFVRSRLIDGASIFYLRQTGIGLDPDGQCRSGVQA